MKISFLVKRSPRAPPGDFFTSLSPLRFQLAATGEPNCQGFSVSMVTVEIVVLERHGKNGKTISKVCFLSVFFCFFGRVSIRLTFYENGANVTFKL